MLHINKVDQWATDANLRYSVRPIRIVSVRTVDFTDWTSWDTCTIKCGGGLLIQSRLIIVPSLRLHFRFYMVHSTIFVGQGAFQFHSKTQINLLIYDMCIISQMLNTPPSIINSSWIIN